MVLTSENEVRDKLYEQYDHSTAEERFAFVDTGSEIEIEDTYNDEIYPVKYAPENKTLIWEEVYEVIEGEIL